MPFGIRRGKGDCAFEVFNSDTGDGVEGGCHPTRAKALSHQRALQSNVDDAESTSPLPGEHFHAVAHIEGKSTGRRTFLDLSWREPPFSFHWQKASSAHGGVPQTVAVGLVTRVVRDPDDGEKLHAFGKLDLDDTDGVSYADKLVKGFQRWVSIGLDESPFETEIEWPEDADGDDDDPMAGVFKEPSQVTISGGKIGELTGVSVPAQAEAEVEPTPELVRTMRALSEAAPLFRKAGDEKTESECPDGQVWDPEAGRCVDAPTDAASGPDPEKDECPEGHVWDSDAGDCVPTDAANPHHDEDGKFTHGPGGPKRKRSGWPAKDPKRSKLPEREKGADDKLDEVDDVEEARRRRDDRLKQPLEGRGRSRFRWKGRQRRADAAAEEECPEGQVWNAETGECEEVSMADVVQGITAAAYRIEIPDLPPPEWFEEPSDIEIPGAFCVTDDGRIFGILAPLNVGHRAYANSGRRLTVPSRNVDYSRFLGGEALTSAGRISGVGPITMDCGHAPRFRENGEVAPAHYENACTVVGKVRVGETADGLPWVAGALEPGVTPDQLSRMLACRLSGDWQPHPDKPGQQELVAALLVPSPGFPMGRTGPTVTQREGVLVASSVPVRYIGDGGVSALDPFEVVTAAAAEAGSDEWARRARRLNAMRLRLPPAAAAKGKAKSKPPWLKKDDDEPEDDPSSKPEDGTEKAEDEKSDTAKGEKAPPFQKKKKPAAAGSGK